MAVLIDTKGPEIRLGTFKEPRVELRSGELFVLTIETVEGDDRVASISFPGLPADVSRGSHILIDDGLIDLEVQKTTETEITCTVINGGFVSANKGVNVPGTSLSMPFMSDRDKADIAFACEMEADFIAASFTRRADDVLRIRQELEANDKDVYKRQRVDRVHHPPDELFGGKILNTAVGRLLSLIHICPISPTAIPMARNSTP